MNVRRRGALLGKENGSQDLETTKADLFDAISHPVRIKILEALNEKPMGFAELGRAVGIESGGHLSFHLTKLRHLIRTNSRGDYALTADGKEALRAVHVPVPVKSLEGKLEPATLDILRIAVLPFTSISPDPKDAYFADGLTEELITRISLVKGLEVIARTSVMGFKRKDKKVSEIGRELRVGTLLEGSVRKDGNKIRVSAQLINADTEGHLWGQNYDRSVEDIFAVQSEIAEKMAEALKVKILPRDSERLSRARTTNMEAYASYLKGMRATASAAREDIERAEVNFERAITLDRDFAEAYTGLAGVYAIRGIVGDYTPAEAYEKAYSVAVKALALDDTLAEAHEAIGAAYSLGLRMKEAMREHKRALELNPNYVTARYMYAYALMYDGRMDEAILEFKKAEELDPIGTARNGGLCIAYLAMGDEENAFKVAKRFVEIEPDDMNASNVLGYLYLKRGEREEALRYFNLLSEKGGKGWSGYLGYGLAKVGEREEAKKILDRLIEKSKSSYVAPTIVAMIYAGMGDREKAFEWLDKAAQVKDPQLVFLPLDHPWFELRSDPRFSKILKTAGL